jgi:hypothetical protein
MGGPALARRLRRLINGPVLGSHCEYPMGTIYIKRNNSLPLSMHVDLPTKM